MNREIPESHLQIVTIRLGRGSGNRFKVILLLAGSHHTPTKNPKVLSSQGNNQPEVYTGPYLMSCRSSTFRLQ